MIRMDCSSPRWRTVSCWSSAVSGTLLLILCVAWFNLPHTSSRELLRPLLLLLYALYFSMIWFQCWRNRHS